MKKLSVLLLVTVLSFSIIGCSAKEELTGAAEEINGAAEDLGGPDDSEADLTSSADVDEYASEIDTEVNDIIMNSEDLTSELESLVELEDKWRDKVGNCQTQTEMNSLCDSVRLIWQIESDSLMSRIEVADKSLYDAAVATEWEKYVDTMADRMTYLYEGGSIYSMMWTYNAADRYKENAFGLASTLADLNGEVAFMLPERKNACGYYGDYTSDSYLIINEGMESGTFDVLVHVDDKTEFSGTAEVTNDDVQELTYTGEDGTTGSLSCWALGATLTTDTQTYDFTGRY
ncbi:hypothetical protein SAMN02910298_00089 [Pseudobutyrivibrio sp. YE44]|uniref:hypothetical protein n=1 Tax=Pseudobutyrivibrio sp. YE44 TaxID=1520802 RepID=UPI00088C0536|nr:hypothetical protein [Pseudobutyrivibrio sp. YE44]SDB05109.1 hypothetical protein SAMN02910298_00089 [Pseudobutyrivibrio sp. YE44]